MRATILALLVVLATPGAPAVERSQVNSRQSNDGEGPIVRVGFARAGRYLVTAMPLETYVAEVLAGEAARGSGPTALEALAITIRTFALANLGRHRADGFDLCDQTHCQVVRAATAATEHAASATAGKVLLYRGTPAQVFYTASCGGRTERPSAVWPDAEDPPFLVSHKDPAGDLTPWSSELTAESLGRALAAAGFRGRLTEMRVMSRTDSGRVAKLRLSGLTPAEISGQDLRVAVGRTLGWQHIKSTAFDLEQTSTAYRFTGHGSGHGVGLCVTGSVAIAARGQSLEQVLATYFPGLELGRVAPTKQATDIVLSLPAGDEGERNVIVALTKRARDDLVGQLGTPKPDRLVLRFHPTVDSYQRATGQAWYTVGGTVSGESHFVPLTILRERGVLERTIRREIVRRLTADALRSRPLWVREGIANYFAGERPFRGTVPDVRPLDKRRVSCPDDPELRWPASPGALSNAHARATACVERQISAGRTWTEVK